MSSSIEQSAEKYDDGNHVSRYNIGPIDPKAKPTCSSFVCLGKLYEQKTHDGPFEYVKDVERSETHPSNTNTIDSEAPEQTELWRDLNHIAYWMYESSGKSDLVMAGREMINPDTATQKLYDLTTQIIERTKLEAKQVGYTDGEADGRMDGLLRAKKTLDSYIAGTSTHPASDASVDLAHQIKTLNPVTQELKLEEKS